MKRRASGILLHITSLPSPYGIGDLGPEAYRFADFLAEARQGFWQILPLNPTRINFGNSPYDSPSAFAGNPLLISPLLLVENGLLSKSDIEDLQLLSRFRVDYPAVTKYKGKIFTKAYQNFKDRRKENYEFEQFCTENSHWLEDYAFFSALNAHFKNEIWHRWPRSLRDRDEKELNCFKESLKGTIEIEKFLQFLFYKQWFSLKAHCNSKSIQIIGDIPIYVSYDSADVWGNPEIFNLDENKRPLVVAGVPPDYFSTTGQLWGNPIYRWDVLKETQYSWWIKRLTHNLVLSDIVRLDHFRGFVDYWEVSAKEQTALNGRWVKGPAEDLFNTIRAHFPLLPFIAEDLGIITPEVHELRDRFELPGMRILQFAFGDNSPTNLYKPINYIKNCVAYTGTHDNDTLIGWLYGSKDYSVRNPDEIRTERENALGYLGFKGNRKDIHWEFIRLLMMSVANLVIFPMQDILGLGNEARMNRPAKTKGNWEWRIVPEQLSASLVKKLSEMTETYGRA
jgi:4-alpha-glucanotransferase